MNILISHPTGNANVRAVANSFAKNGVLSEFVTSIATFPGSILDKLSRFKPFSELERRRFDPKLAQVTRMYPLKEIGRLAALKAGISSLTQRESGQFSIDAVYRNLDHCVMKRFWSGKYKNVQAVYAYEDGALGTFTAAKELGLTCIYDLPIAYWQTLRSLLTEEAERLPNWKKTLGGGIEDSAEKLDRKTKELELADLVVGPGQFVIDSLPDWAKQKKQIISPFGSPDTTSVLECEEKSSPREGRPLRILFAGSMGQRKGLGDLMAAMKMVRSLHVELVVMGSLLDTPAFYREQFAHFTYEPGRPHSDVLQLMRTCDVFCLPSIVEGRALVMQEAMSQGLPLIITPNTGGADLIIEGETGFLVPIRSPEKIAEKIDWFAANTHRLREMGEAARRHAANYTWEKYGQTIVEGVKEFCDTKLTGARVPVASFI